jgi:hypothetical protein
MKNAWRLSLLVCLLTAVALSQSQSSSQSSGNGSGDGKDLGGYQTQQSIEFGYRFTDVTGNEAMYNTLIDQSQGPRLLEQTLSMRSPEHQGVLFDDLMISSFGWGGDPENVARVTVRKYKWYDFRGLFRRDHNYFDYDLFANPLNPPTATPFIPVNFSPHSMYITRRMYDFGLTLLPESKFSIRLGYSRNREDGPSYSTVHEGTEALLYQPWNVTENSYRFGLDYKGLTRTTISYDQFLTYDKNDTDYFLAPFATFTLSNGSPVEFGVPWNPAASAPCARPLIGTAANPSCNGFFNYSRLQRVRSHTPTERLSLTSNYFRRVNFTANASYSSTDLSTPLSEFFNGLITRTNQRQFTTSGTGSTRRVATSADGAVTVEVNRYIRIADNFRYDNFHLPGFLTTLATSTVGATTPATLLTPLGVTTSSTSQTATFMGMKTIDNQFQIEYIPSKIAGVSVGYRLRHRHWFHAEPELLDPEAGFEPFEGDDITVNEHGPTLNVWMRPTDSIRLNVDVEALTADNFITRISPRQQQLIRARGSYTPARWGTFSASAVFNQSSNGEIDTDYRQHYRNYGALATLFPNDRFNLELNYNYTDAQQNAYICYNGTFIAPGTVVGGCPTFDPAANNNPNWIYSNFFDNVHYFSGLVMFKPVKKLTANVGYGITKSNGNTTILNPLQPLATLDFTYHQPLASLSYQVVKAWSLNAYWNYDQYKENSFVGPTLPRYFHDNRTVLSVKYAF